MNETFDQAQFTQILYEISMSIGGSTDLRKMLKPSLSTILKKLNCVSGGVYQAKLQANDTYLFEAAYTIPRRPTRNETYQEALANLPDTPTEAEYADFLATLPQIEQSKEGHYYHIFELPGFGLLLLVKNREPLTEQISKSLIPLLIKLASASIGCINEAKLRQSEERYRLFTDATFDGIMIHDGPIVTEINPALAATISYTPEELIGTNIFDFLDPSCHDLASANAQKLAEAPYKLIAVRKDGQRLPVEVVDREYVEDGKTYRITAVRDLSRQKQLETELESLVERRTRQVQISTQVAQAIAATTNLDDLYQRVVTEVKEQFGYYHTQLLRYDPETNGVKLIAGYGDIGAKMQAEDHTMPVRKGLIGTAVSTGETVLRPDLSNDPDWHSNPFLPDTKGEIAVPIKLGDEILGVLNVQSDTAGALNTNDQLLLEGLCGQIAVAIDTARLVAKRQETEEALRQSEQLIQNTLDKQRDLHEVSLALAAIDDLDELYQQAVKMARERLGFDRIGLFLLDPKAEIMFGTYGTGPDGKFRSEIDTQFNIAEEPWISELIYKKERLEVIEDDVIIEGEKELGRGWHIFTALWIRNRLVGLFLADNLVSQEPMQAYQPELLAAYGSNVANLIEQKRAEIEREQLLQHTEKQANNLSLLNELNATLNKAKNSEEIYKIIGEFTQIITGDERTSLALLTSDRQMIELYALKGIKGAVPLGTQLPVDGTGIGLALQEKRQISYPEEAAMDTYFDTKKMAEEGLQSAIITPLIVDNVVIGSLNSASKKTAKDSSQKKKLLQQITSLTSSALQVKQAQERTETILQSITVPMLVSRVSDGMILYANEHLADMIQLPLNELVGKQTPNFYVHNSDREIVINKIKTDGGLQNYELELQRTNEEHFWSLLTAKLIQFEGETAIITSLIDISDRKETQAATERQAADLQTVADLSTHITSIQDPNMLMETIVQETQQRFALYHCHIFLVDDSGRNLRIQACGWHPDAQDYGTHGDSVIPMKAKQSLVAQAARTKQAVVINDVHKDPNWLPNELLPDTRAELAVPIVIGDTVLGVLDVQSTEVDRFGTEDVKIQSTLASQIAVALENARSLEQSKQALAELDDLTRRLTRDSWEEFLSEEDKSEMGFAYEFGELKSINGNGKTAPKEDSDSTLENQLLSQALTVHGEAIGHLTIFNEEQSEQLDEDAALIMAAIAEQLSARVENIRLTEQTQSALAQTQIQAQRLGMLNEISATMSNVDTLDQVFDVVISRIADLLKADQISVTMLEPDNENVKMYRVQGAGIDVPIGAVVPMEPIITQAVQDNRVITSQTEFVIGGDTKSSMVAPISSAGRVIGTLNIGSKQKGAFSSRDENLMQQLATMLSSVVENKQLLAAAQARAERERQVRTITDRIRRGADREAILNIAQKEISQLIGAKQTAVQLGTKAQLLERIQQTIEKTETKD